MDLYLHYIIIFCEFQPFFGNALLLFLEVLMKDDLLFISKTKEPAFWETLVQAVVRAVSEKGEAHPDENT